MRTKIEKISERQVDVTRDGETIRYWAPESGYVRDITHAPGTLGRQVCGGLAYMGSTLRREAGQSLLDIIRRENRRRGI